MVSTRKKKSQQKTQLNQLNDFIIGDGTNVNAMEKETLEQQTNGLHRDFDRFDNSLSENYVIESNTDDRIRNAVDNAPIAVENRTQEAILPAMNDVVVPRVEMAVRSITGSSGYGTNCIAQNQDRRDCTGNTYNTPLRSASNR